MKYGLPLLAFCAFFPFATLAEEKEFVAEKQESTAEAQEIRTYSTSSCYEEPRPRRSRTL